MHGTYLGAFLACGEGQMVRQVPEPRVPQISSLEPQSLRSKEVWGACVTRDTPVAIEVNASTVCLHLPRTCHHIHPH